MNPIDYIQSFRDPKNVKPYIEKIQTLSIANNTMIMEVCGTHTHAFFHTGLRTILPETVQLVSGPGCPVCVTPNDFLDKALVYAQKPEVIITTFGDLMRVPSSTYSLEQIQSESSQIQVVYSPQDALLIAEKNPSKRVCFLAVGFETTIPTIGATLLSAKEKNLDNFFLLTSMKTVIPALKVLVEDDDIDIKGFILPGHVSVILGEKPYQFLANTYAIPGVITGFEPLDLVLGLWTLLQMIQTGDPKIANAYPRLVKPEGNPVAREIMTQVFQPCDAAWRGIGVIPNSGLKLSEAFAHFDIELQDPIQIPPPKEHAACLCGEILKGKKSPPDCQLFGTICTPEHPVGACMVSMEGTCSAFHKSGTYV